MITRVPMNISAGTRDARELLVSLLVESLDRGAFHSTTARMQTSIISARPQRCGDPV